MFKFVSDVSKRNTRYVDKTKLYLLTGKHLKMFTDSFAYSAVEVCNTTPNNIRNCETISELPPPLLYPLYPFKSI